MTPRQLLCAVTLATLGLGGCTAGSGTSTAAPPSTAGSTAPAAGPTPPARPTSGSTLAAGTAETDLAAFLTATQRVDARLRVAADRINAAITPDQIRLDPATVAAVTAADRNQAAAAIPPGLPSALLQRVITVQSDLVSRRAAMAQFGTVAGTWLRTDSWTSDWISWLGHGSTAARRFPADLAAVRDLARTLPPVSVAAPTSVAAAELGARVAIIRMLNTCSDTYGGIVVTDLQPISWQRRPTSTASGHGVYGAAPTRLPFDATYRTGSGWAIDITTC